MPTVGFAAAQPTLRRGYSGAAVPRFIGLRRIGTICAMMSASRASKLCNNAKSLRREFSNTARRAAAREGIGFTQRTQQEHGVSPTPSPLGYVNPKPPHVQ